MNNQKRNKLNEIIKKGEISEINGKKTLILPYIEPEYIPKKKRPSKGLIKRAHKNNG